MKTKLTFSSVTGKGYDDFFKTKRRYRIVKGSRASKKSKSTALDIVRKIITHPLCNWLVVRRYACTLKDSCYADIVWAIEKLNKSEDFKCKLSPLEITYTPTGQKILFRGLDDGMKITSLSVPKGVLCFVWIEEAFEITNEEDFNKLDLSIRGTVPDDLFKQITLTFNPWSEETWIKSRFFDKPNDNIFTKTTTWRCNEWIDNNDKKIFLDMEKNNPRRAKVESFGQWGISEGLIFENFKVQSFNPEEIKLYSNITSSFSLDFGFTDPNAFICALIDFENYKIYVFDEWYKSNVTNKDIAEQITKMGYSKEIIVCDSAEPKSIQELRSRGIKAIPAKKSADSVNFGIQFMQNFEFIIHPKCTNFFTEIKNYAWIKDKNGKNTSVPCHTFSHGMDSLRYGILNAKKEKNFSFK